MNPLITVHLYDNDLSTPSLIEDITGRIENLNFSTILHGGFGIAQFDLAAGWAKRWQWRIDYWLYRLVIYEKDYTIFEGRLEDVEFIKDGLRATFFGYYSNLGDLANNGAATESGNADVIIKSWLTNYCSQISADQTNIESPGISLSNVAEIDDTLLDLVPKLADFSDASKQTWYFAVWEDRIAYFFARSITAVDWLVNLRDIESLSLRASIKELWNSVFAVYTSGGTETRTSTTSDSDSISKYGITRRKGIPNLGDVGATAAGKQRDWWLEEHKELWQQTDRFIIGATVFDTNGVRHPSCRVRAGDVIRIQDLMPASVNVSQVARDALRTFYIRETQYNADKHRMTIIPDTESMNLDSILAREL